jgi:hypothetical protein
MLVNDCCLKRLPRTATELRSASLTAVTERASLATLDVIVGDGEQKMPGVVRTSRPTNRLGRRALREEEEKEEDEEEEEEEAGDRWPNR